MNSFLNPEQVLQELDIEENMSAAEFGCGSGKFAFALARHLADSSVYAIDIQEGPLSVLRAAAARQGINNIRTICSDLESKNGSTLSDDSLDLILIPNLLFQVEDKQAVVNEANRVLKKNGRVIIIDWDPNASLGPEKERKVTMEEVKKIAEQVGFDFKKEIEVGAFHYGLLFDKK